MASSTMKRALICVWLAASASALMPAQCASLRRTSVVSRMGIFDEIKGAFNSADENVAIDESRETPIDRWLGISTKQTVDRKQSRSAFVDSMDEANYFSVSLTKPMGVVFEENDPAIGGVFVASLAADGAAATEGTIKVGDQLTAVGQTSVLGMTFDGALGEIVASDGETTKLVVFRGGTSNLYGNLGPSTEWLDEFLAKQ